MARISTHVLDLALGRPAANLRVELFRVSPGSREVISSAVTNSDGRTDPPLLTADSIETGIYELVFHAGEYLRVSGAPVNEPPFFEEIPVRFHVSAARGNYHVPLLLAPHGYSTYRGS